MSAVARAAAALIAAVASAACHYHRDLDGPGVIDPAVPPADVTRRGLEPPGDPGERMLVLTTGGLVGPFGGSVEPGAVVDFAAEATLSWGENPTHHNDRGDRLFVPRGVLLPRRSTGVTLGWSGLRVVTHAGADSEAKTGPLYVEVQRSWLLGGLGAGWAFDPATGGTGPQVNAFYTFFFLRGRVLVGDGWELGGGLQLKIPNTWVWSR